MYRTFSISHVSQLQIRRCKGIYALNIILVFGEYKVRED
jgi:hypothetical protein